MAGETHRPPWFSFILKGKLSILQFSFTVVASYGVVIVHAISIYLYGSAGIYMDCNSTVHNNKVDLCFKVFKLLESHLAGLLFLPLIF